MHLYILSNVNIVHKPMILRNKMYNMQIRLKQFAAQKKDEK